MKIKRNLIIGLIIFSLGCLSSLFVIWYLNPQSNPFTRSSAIKKSAAFALLEEVQDIYSLHTAEYTMKVIFPYDFIEKDADWNILQYYYDYDREIFIERSNPSYYPDRKLPPTWANADFYALCREAGFDLAKDQQFFVITAVVKAGYNLEPLAGENSPETIEEVEEWVRVEEDDSGELILHLKKPEPVITDFIIQDTNLKESGYPDVVVSPEEWSALITRLSPLIREKVLFRGILREADKNGKLILEQIFKGAGYDKVVFH